MTIETGALEQGYAKIESAYAVSASTGGEALSATDGIRILDLAITSKKNREASPERRGTPDEAQSLPRRQTTNWNLSQIMWEPSGTLGTQSNVGKFLECGMGAKTTPNLATTIASGASTTGATLTSGSGLAVGDLVVVTMASGARREATRLKTVSGAIVTWDALSGTPDSPGAVVSGVNYKLASNITQTLAIYRYFNAGGFKQAAFGCVVDQIEIMFDGTTEVMLALQGPGGQYADSSTGGGTVQAKPGAFTTIGTPASGLIGNFYVDGNAFLVISAKVTVQNNEELRNKELGTSFATGIAGRNNLRKVMCEVTFYLEDTRLIGMANSITKGVLRVVVGQTNGNMVAAVLPSVEFEIPDVPNDIGPKVVTISGIGYATSGNDQVFLGEL